MSAKAFESYLPQASSAAASAAKTFLASPAVARATAVWDAVCGAQPPRPALARLARRFGVDAAETYGYWNFDNKKEFKREARMIQKWYAGGRQLTRPRRGLNRTHGDAEVKGRKSAWTRKTSAHYKRLLKPLCLQGLIRWRRCALALHRAGYPVHSGTMGVGGDVGWG